MNNMFKEKYFPQGHRGQLNIINSQNKNDNVLLQTGFATK